jgi:hypothetical protein
MGYKAVLTPDGSSHIGRKCSAIKKFEETTF